MRRHQCRGEVRQIQGVVATAASASVKLGTRERYFSISGALRPAHRRCYTCVMRMQGQRDRGSARILAGRRRGAERAAILLFLGLMPGLAACSSFSSSSSTAVTNPPATYQPTSAQANGSIPPAAPASDPALSFSPYPSKSLVDLFTGSPNPPAAPAVPAAPAATGSSAAAPGAPHPPSTYTATSPPYQSNQPGYAASANSAAAPATPAAAASQDSSDEPALMPYPKQSLSDIFSR